MLNFRKRTLALLVTASMLASLIICMPVSAAAAPKTYSEAPAAAVYSTAVGTTADAGIWNVVSSNTGTEGQEWVKYLKYDISAMSGSEIVSATIDFGKASGINAQDGSLYVRGYNGGVVDFKLKVDAVACGTDWTNATGFSSAYGTALPAVSDTLVNESIKTGDSANSNGWAIVDYSYDIKDYIQTAANAGKEAVYFRISFVPSVASNTNQFVNTPNIKLNAEYKTGNRTYSEAPAAAVYSTAVGTAEDAGIWNVVSSNTGTEGQEWVKYLKYDISAMSGSEIVSATIDFGKASGINAQDGSLYVRGYNGGVVDFKLKVDAVACGTDWTNATGFSSAYGTALPAVSDTLVNESIKTGDSANSNGWAVVDYSYDIKNYIQTAANAGKEAVYFRISFVPSVASNTNQFVNTPNIKLNAEYKPKDVLEFSYKQGVELVGEAHINTTDMNTLTDGGNIITANPAAGERVRYIKYNIADIDASKISSVKMTISAMYDKDKAGYARLYEVTGDSKSWTDTDTFIEEYNESGYAALTQDGLVGDFGNSWAWGFDPDSNGTKSTIDITTWYKAKLSAGGGNVTLKLVYEGVSANTSDLRVSYYSDIIIEFNDNVITELPANLSEETIISVKWKSYDGGDSPFSVLPILAAKEDGKLTNITVGEALTLDGTGQTTTLEVSLKGITDFEKAKIEFLRWDSLTNLKPLYGVIPLQ